MKIELDVRLKNRTRQNFVDLVTSLQKRAYEINAENAVEAQKLLVKRRKENFARENVSSLGKRDVSIGERKSISKSFLK